MKKRNYVKTTVGISLLFCILFKEFQTSAFASFSFSVPLDCSFVNIMKNLF